MRVRPFLIVGGLIGIASAGHATTDDVASEILITSARVDRFEAAATADSFLVTWLDRSSAGVSLLARIVSNEGVAGPPIVVTNTAHGADFTTAGGDDSFLVTWTHRTSLLGMRISSEGALLDSEPFVIRSNEEIFEQQAVWNGTGWAVIWLEDDSEFASRFNPLGHIARDGTVDPRLHDARPFTFGNFAWNGRDYLIPGGSYQAATLMGPDGQTKRAIRLPDGESISSIARLGDDFLAFGYGGSAPGAWSVVIDGDGVVHEETRRSLGSHVSYPAVAPEDGNFLVHEQMGTDEPDLYVGDVRILGAAWRASASANDDVAIVAAKSTRGLIARCVPRHGPIAPATPVPPRAEPTPLPPIAMTLGAVVRLGEGSHPQVASNGRNFLVSWNSSERLWVQAVSAADGAQLGRPVVLSDDRGSVEIGTSDDGTFIALWSAGYEVRVRRISADGRPLDIERVIWNDHASDATVTFANGQWIVAFESNGSLVTLLLDREGAVIDEAVADFAIYSGISLITLGDVVFLASSRTLFRLEGIEIVRPGIPLVPVWAGAANDGWSIATQHGRTVFAYDCAHDCSEAEPPSASSRRSTWTVDLDSDGKPIEATRRRHLEPPLYQPRVAPLPRALVAGYHYYGPARSVFVDDVLVIPDVLVLPGDHAGIASTEESALVVATVDSGHVVMRWISFAPLQWGPIPVPSSDSDDERLFGCAVTPSHEAVPLALLLAALASCALRRRRRTRV